jgi:hypothetical protein
MSRTAARVVALYLATAALVVAGFEAWLRSTRTERGEVAYSKEYAVRDALLGKRPEPDVAVRATKRFGDEIAYDVVYTIGPNRLRVGPPDRGAAAEGCVLFFGCSYTYGEGVGDSEPMAYRVGVLSDGRYRTYNFGFHGYGPHQMLAWLEADAVAGAVDCRPTHLVYTAIPDHVRRVAGLRTFGRHGPRYRLDAAGGVQRAGHFDDDKTFAERMEKTLPLWLRASAIFQRSFNRPRALGDRDFELYVAVLRRARELAMQRWPGLDFEVLLWPVSAVRGDDALYAEIHRRLAEAGLAPHALAATVPGLAADDARFRLPHDLHPNAAAHDAVARYVLGSILDRE